MEFKIIVESLLTASQFDVTVIASDRILVLKKSIEKILGRSFNNIDPTKVVVFTSNY